MKRMVMLLLILAMNLPCHAVSAERLQYALPEEAAEILGTVDSDNPDVQRGFSRLFSAGKEILRNGLKESVKTAFLMAAVCLLLALLQGYAKRERMSEKPAWLETMTGAL